jgi:hypothetical protein
MSSVQGGGTTMVAAKRRGVQSRSKDDVIERFFQWGETALCPPADEDKMDTTTDPDVLDYVFESVESFTCAADAPHVAAAAAGRELLLLSDNACDGMSLQRDNSLIEQGPNGQPTQLVVTKSKTTTTTTTPGAGDLLDYCFEHVESYVCTEGNEALVLGMDMPLIVALEDQLLSSPPASIAAVDSNAEVGRRQRILSKQKTKDSKKKQSKLQKRRAKAAIETQLNAMNTEEQEEHHDEQHLQLQQQKQENKNKRGSWFGVSSGKLFKIKKSNSSSSGGASITSSSNDSIPSVISTTTTTSKHNTPTSTAAAAAAAAAYTAAVPITPPITPPSSVHASRKHAKYANANHDDDDDDENIQMYFRPMKLSTQPTSY